VATFVDRQNSFTDQRARSRKDCIYLKGSKKLSDAGIEAGFDHASKVIQ
jgi:hypothetical protein